MKDLFDNDSVYHEAGHAIASAALGCRVEVVALLRAGELLADGAGGFVNSDKAKNPIEEGAILFAGIVGSAFGAGRDYGLIERGHAQPFKRQAKKYRKQATSGQVSYKPIAQKSDGQLRGLGSFDIVEARKLIKDGSDFELSQKVAMACIALNLPLLHELAKALKDHFGLLRGADLQSILFRAVKPSPAQVGRL
jgi:hypothetical protein